MGEMGNEGEMRRKGLHSGVEEGGASRNFFFFQAEAGIRDKAT